MTNVFKNFFFTVVEKFSLCAMEWAYGQLLAGHLPTSTCPRFLFWLLDQPSQMNGILSLYYWSYFTRFHGVFFLSQINHHDNTWKIPRKKKRQHYAWLNSGRTQETFTYFFSSFHLCIDTVRSGKNTRHYSIKSIVQ